MLMYTSSAVRYRDMPKSEVLVVSHENISAGQVSMDNSQAGEIVYLLFSGTYWSAKEIKLHIHPSILSLQYNVPTLTVMAWLHTNSQGCYIWFGV